MKKKIKKKIFIIGSRGMAGHRIFEYLDSLDKYEITDIAREKLRYQTLCLDVVSESDRLKILIGNYKPDIIINCVGLLISACENDPLNALAVNACFPYVLEEFTKHLPTKIIHLSTDCVFDGKKGDYDETDEPNAKSIYAKTKALGELNDGKNLTLRLSIIGDELKENGSGLFNWFMRQTGVVNGYTECYWSGITTLELSKQIDKIIDTTLTGIYHLAPNFNISKYDLLLKINKTWDRNWVLVSKHYYPKSDKTLVNNRKKEYDPQIPSYNIQLKEMKEWIERKQK